jgi:hypothetical protein
MFITDNTEVSIGDFAVSASGPLSLAGSLTDTVSSAQVRALADNLVMTLPAPSNTSVGRANLMTILNNDTSLFPITLYGNKIDIGKSAQFIFAFGAWHAMQNTPIAGNVISAFTDLASQTPVVQFDNLKVRYNPVTNNFEIATVVNTETIRSFIEAQYVTASLNTVNNNSSPATLAVTTTYQQLGDAGITAPGESRTHHIYDASSKRNYTVKAVYLAAPIARVWFEVSVFGGVSNNQVLSFQGPNLVLQNGVVTFPNKVSSGPIPYATAQIGTQVTVGEFQFRYNQNALNGNLELRSSTSGNVSFHSYAYEQFPATPAPSGHVHQAAIIANAVAGTFQTVPAGGLGTREILTYEIKTSLGVYHVKLYDYNSTSVELIAERK